MAKRKLPPATSIEANQSIQEMKPDHHAKILEALRVIGEASAEQIAFYLNMDHSQINRRVSEIAEKGLIFRPGNKVATLTGRSAYTWKLCEEGEENRTVSEKVPEGEGISYFSRNIQRLAQKELF